MQEETQVEAPPLEKPQPKPQVEVAEKPQPEIKPSPPIIPDDFADQIASKVAEKMRPVTPPPAKKRKYTKKPKAPVQSPIPEKPQLVPEAPRPPAFKFSWM